MIHAIIKLQGCTSIPGRRAFVVKGQDRHGIAAGPVGLYKVTAATWANIRSIVASADSTGRKTMNFSGIGPDTVEQYWETPETATGSSLKPLKHTRPGYWGPVRNSL